MSIPGGTEIVNPTVQKRTRGRPRDASKDEAIVRAAQRLFLDRGYEGTSVEAIAEAAGVAKATVYARFADKETLLKEAIAAKCAQFLDADTLEPGDGRGLRESLRIIGRRFLALVTDPDPVSLHRVMMNEGLRHPRLTELFFQSAIEPNHARFARFLQAEAAAGRLNIPDPETAAWQFLAMVKGEAYMRAILYRPPRPAAEIEAYVDACVDMFLAAYGTGRP
jgi:TetR/AcrR family transcriptional repressor of mexJK operon